MDSTFYSDGFTDGLKGLKASPPDPYTFAGNTTTVYASEYLQGWVKGHREYLEEKASRSIGFGQPGYRG